MNSITSELWKRTKERARKLINPGLAVQQVLGLHPGTGEYRQVVDKLSTELWEERLAGRKSPRLKTRPKKRYPAIPPHREVAIDRMMTATNK